MDQLPNWFRWLMIVIATLIMCACRSPLQRSAAPVLDSQPLIDNADGELDSAPATTQSDDLSSLHDELVQLRQTDSQTTPVAEPTDSRLEQPQMAPVVLRALNGGQPQVMQIPAAVALEPQSQPARQNPAPKPADQTPEAATEAAGPSEQEEISAAELVYHRITDGQDNASDQATKLAGSTSSSRQSLAAQDQPIRITSGTVDELIEHDGSAQRALGSPSDKEVSEEYVVSMEIDGTSIMDVPPGYCMTCDGFVVPQHQVARMYPDEYICDGGDSMGRVRVRADSSLRGLDPEDTVGHFQTGGDEVVIQPSNQVCIYAPRFAATRKVSAAHQSEAAEQVVVAERNVAAGIEERNLRTNDFQQSLAVRRHLLVQPAGSIGARQPGVEGVHRRALMMLDHDLAPHEDLQIMKYGMHAQSEKALLQKYVARAATWSSDKAVQVVIDEAVIQTNVSRQGTQSLFVIGDNDPAKLRVIKTASVADALPGEEVEFTLRFDNIGSQPMHSVTLVDNLTTRLEFLEGSDQCSVQSEFEHDPNRVDSLTLKWRITESIDAGQGGIIRFRCRVR